MRGDEDKHFIRRTISPRVYDGVLSHLGFLLMGLY